MSLYQQIVSQGILAGVRQVEAKIGQTVAQSYQSTFANRSTPSRAERSRRGRARALAAFKAASKALVQ